MTTTKKPKFIFSVGRKKTTVARIRLYKGKGEFLVNDLAIEKYFPGEISRRLYQEPLKTCNVLDKYFATIKLSGSGKASQLGAVVHGLARALVLLNPEFKPALRKKGFLTRDSRQRERRKVGTGGKARRQKQSPKR